MTSNHRSLQDSSTTMPQSNGDRRDFEIVDQTFSSSPTSQGDPRPRRPARRRQRAPGVRAVNEPGSITVSDIAVAYAAA